MINLFDGIHFANPTVGPFTDILINFPRKMERAKMVRRSAFILAFVSVIILSGSARAQGYFQFLGAPQTVPDRYSPRFGIRYNTQGYDVPDVNWKKRAAKLARKGVPEFAINEMMQFPGASDAIGEWIDKAMLKYKLNS